MPLLVGKMCDFSNEQKSRIPEIAQNYAVTVSDFVRKLSRTPARDSCDDLWGAQNFTLLS
jgi:hypothetical protein